MEASLSLVSARSGAHDTAKTMIEDVLTIRAEAWDLIFGVLSSVFLFHLECDESVGRMAVGSVGQASGKWSES